MIVFVITKCRRRFHFLVHTASWSLSYGSSYLKRFFSTFASSRRILVSSANIRVIVEMFDDMSLTYVKKRVWLFSLRNITNNSLFQRYR